ncbi:hypothetical protein DUNSADRAFT_18111 [Dunaliella salina]|uniref:Uncharacterized protein n=1 Tax=Dunaliella salina TaxID=3046 RepID=A0ABQ7G0N9_DUNSA|nr:hypothetical protein DUNSADRAFT_18111 [Dunaliella salina]|eukprot:KAF5828157.1 hypothetical protein DUNSADRAFT_18111 [Dunaliella salina]
MAKQGSSACPSNAKKLAIFLALLHSGIPISISHHLKALIAITLKPYNIYCLMTWCRKKFPGEEEQLANFFKENGYSDDLDYL